jgi:photosystem II stability/assembly factor-like uncharacterized protein
MEVTSRNIRDIEVLGRQGYLTGDRGLLMKSTNGGATWTDISLNIKYNFSGVAIVNDSTAIICGTDQNSMSKTVGKVFDSWDYGKTWKKHRHLGNGYVDIAANPPKKVFLLAIKKVYHSISWGMRYFPGKYDGSRMAFGFDFMDDWGFMVGKSGYLAKTTTHGREWEEIDFKLDKDLYAVEMFDKESGVAVGEAGIIVYFYKDAYEHIVDYYPNAVNLSTVCITENRIYFGGEDGVMFYKRR